MNAEVAGGTKKKPVRGRIWSASKDQHHPQRQSSRWNYQRRRPPFELNPDSKDNDVQTETQQRIEDDNTEQSNETLPPF